MHSAHFPFKDFDSAPIFLQMTDKPVVGGQAPLEDPLRRPMRNPLRSRAGRQPAAVPRSQHQSFVSPSRSETL
jgi:hypothetical protein